MAVSVYSVSQIRYSEQLAYQQYRFTPAELMRRAGEAAFRCLRHYWPQARRVQIFCGSGNNGGDGYVLAWLAQRHGLEVRIIYIGVGKTDEAIEARRDCEAVGIPMQELGEDSDASWGDVIVDALLGIGIKEGLSPSYALAVRKINQAAKPVLAIDVPTGLDADTGHVLATAVQADKTLTFIGLKAGLFTGEGTNYCGEVLLDDLQLPSELFAAVAPCAEILEWELLRSYLPPRVKNVNKGSFGQVLVVGGNRGMAGAVRMAGEAAARVGAGLVMLATRPEHAAVIASQRPELLCYGVDSVESLRPLVERASVLVVGPGLGQDAWAKELAGYLLRQDHLKVVDADALNLLASEPVYNSNWIVTPHPGEAARLLKISVAEVQQDRFAACAQIQKRYGGVVVLKGAGSLVQAPESLPYICRAGNPGMASAGMGDVLSGILGGLVAQGLTLSQAGPFGVLLHAMAGDLAAQKNGERGMLAQDLMSELQRLVN